jgi:O-antigen ligase
LSTIQQSLTHPNEFAWLTTGTPLERVTRCLAVLTAFSIPLSTSFSEITTSLFMISWLCSGNWRARWEIVRGNTVALWALALFGLLLLGTAWSTAGWLAAVRCLLKYREFLYVPMYLVVFRDAAVRRAAVSAFLLAGAVLLGMSYFEWLTGADLGMKSEGRDFVIGKDHIIHSLIMAIVVFLTAGRLSEAWGALSHSHRKARIWAGLYAALLAFGIYNILFMVIGRTGYLVLATLLCLYCAERMGRRGLAISAAVVAISAWGAFSLSTSIRARVNQTVTQLRNQLGPERKHSIDPRMEFYANSLEMISRHPWLGTGTGSFEREYALQVAGTDDKPTSDPHNEYLSLTCQVGIPGSLLFLGLLAFQWFAAAKLGATERSIGRGVVTAIALGSLFNSLILSVTGGLIYAYFSALAFAELRPVGAVKATGSNAPETASPVPLKQAA